MVKKANAGETKKTPHARAITASELRTHCLRLMDEVNDSGEEIVITKRGKPICRLVPPAAGVARPNR